MKEWEEFEEDVARYVSGSRQAGSGNSCIAYKKGDVKSDNYLIECKQTGADYYTLSYKIWDKIVEEALNAFRIPLLTCRSKAGDFFIGNVIDFDEKPDKILDGCLKSFKVTEPCFFKIQGKNTVYDLVCWSVDLEDVDE